MNISRLSDITSILQKLASSKGRGNSEAAQESGGNATRIDISNRRGSGREVSTERRARNEERKAARESESEAPVTTPGSTPTPAPTDTPNTTEPDTPTTPPVSSSGGESIDELAALYVQQYQQSSGKQLSEEEFNKKKSEVADFYSSFSGGSQRLDNVVFANDPVKA